MLGFDARDPLGYLLLARRLPTVRLQLGVGALHRLVGSKSVMGVAGCGSG
jgi:hypothetical protein